MTEHPSSQGGNPLKEIRDFLGLSQDRFAALMGSTKTTVSRRENGEGEPQLRLSEYKKLEKALKPRGKRVVDFIPDEDDPPQ